MQVPTLSLADTKVATTVFVGNISEKATDTLVRQILLVREYNDDMMYRTVCLLL